MPLSLALSASLAFAIGVAHSYLGERYILIRLFRRTDLPALFGSDWFTRRTLRFAWHLTTVAWWGLGALILLVGGGASRAQLGLAIAATFLASALLAMAGTRGRHLAWVVFLAIAVGTWMGTRSPQ